MSASRMFVSYAAVDRGFAQALATDLWAAGADVWYPAEELSWPALRAALDREMPTRSVFVVVLSPEALADPRVQLAIDVAEELARTHEVQERVAILVRACPGSPTLTAFRVIDATSADRPAATVLLDVLGRSDSHSDASVALVPTSASPVALPLSESAAVLPPRFEALGFKGWRHGDVEFIVPPLCLVPAGPFTMGSEEDASEEPRHAVSLPTFAVATHPVLVAEYACFVRSGHTLPPDVGRVTWNAQFSRLDHPVVNVSWLDAVAFAEWLNRLTGQTWHLPSEAEWEKAARWDDSHGSARAYPWGDQFESSRCNTRESSLGGTTAAGIYPNGASPCGALDMAGNVREWTSTRYLPYPYDARDGREQAAGHGDRVQRGGSWFGFASDARAAFREWHAPEEVSPVVGFRLVLEAPPGVDIP